MHINIENDPNDELFKFLKKLGAKKITVPTYTISNSIPDLKDLSLESNMNKKFYIKKSISDDLLYIVYSRPFNAEVFAGNLSDCYAFIKLSEEGYDLHGF